VEENFVH